MRAWATWIGVTGLLLAFGCGGSQKRADDTATDEGADYEEEEESGDVMVPPEKFDELNQVMTHKQPVVSRCFAAALEEGKITPDTKGTVTLELTVTTRGDARDVKVVESTIRSDAVEDCVVTEISAVKFTTLPKPVTFSYTYKFERDY